MGHRASDDVYGRVYTLDHPELTPLAEVARLLDEIIRSSIGSLLIPTTRRIRWGVSNRTLARSAHVGATLGAAGWTVDPDSCDDPLCDTGRVASELQVAPTTARRWMRDGTLMCVIVKDGNGVGRRWARLSEVWSLRDRPGDRVVLPDLAEESAFAITSCTGPPVGSASTSSDTPPVVSSRFLSRQRNSYVTSVPGSGPCISAR